MRVTVNKKTKQKSRLWLILNPKIILDAVPFFASLPSINIHGKQDSKYLSSKRFPKSTI